MAYMWFGGKGIAEYMCLGRGVPKITGENSSKLKQGIKIDIESMYYRFGEHHKKAPNLEKLFSYDMLHTIWNAPLVSQRVVDLLNEYCGDKIQIIDSEIQLPDGSVNKNYKTINIINRVPVFTWEESVKRSNYDQYNEPNSLCMQEIAYDGQKIDDTVCCKDTLSRTDFNLISESLGNAMKKAKFKGLSLEKAIYGYHIME
jgi:hypothetical protein